MGNTLPVKLSLEQLLEATTYIFSEPPKDKLRSWLFEYAYRCAEYEERPLHAFPEYAPFLMKERLKVYIKMGLAIQKKYGDDKKIKLNLEEGRDLDTLIHYEHKGYINRLFPYQEKLK
jgi:hypothetical protein